LPFTTFVFGASFYGKGINGGCLKGVLKKS